jgi:hypothetical protein
MYVPDLHTWTFKHKQAGLNYKRTPDAARTMGTFSVNLTHYCFHNEAVLFIAGLIKERRRRVVD